MNLLQLTFQVKVSDSNSSGATASSSSKSEEYTLAKKLEQDCYQELFEFVQTMAISMGCSTGSMMANISLMPMSRTMPQTEKEMLQIVGMTEANFKKCGGKSLLEITQRYANLREGEKKYLPVKLLNVVRLLLFLFTSLC